MKLNNLLLRAEIDLLESVCDEYEQTINNQNMEIVKLRTTIHDLQEYINGLTTLNQN